MSYPCSVKTTSLTSPLNSTTGTKIMKNKKTAPVSSPDEDLGKALIKETATNARKLLIYSRAEGLSPQETLFSMVLCVATLADALEMDEGTVCAGIHAALEDLNSADEEE